MLMPRIMLNLSILWQVSTGYSVSLTVVGGPVEMRYGLMNYKSYVVNEDKGAQINVRCSFKF